MNKHYNIKKGQVIKYTKFMKILVLILVIISYRPFNSMASFEDMEIGAKATSLAGSFVGLANDISGIFYNPAGLVSINRPEIFASFEKMYWGLTDKSSLGNQTVAFGLPLKIGNIGFGWHMLSLKKLYTESIVKFGYGFKVKKNIDLGLSISGFQVGYGETKYTKLNPVFDNGYKKSAVGVDFGIIHKGEFINFGLSVMNINEPDVGLKYENKVIRKINVGISINQKILNLNLATVINRGEFRFKTGIETWIFSRDLALRGGVNFGSRKYRNAALGIGYKSEHYAIDYSMNYPLSGIANTYGSHQMSFIFRWGNEEEEEEEEFTWKNLAKLIKEMRTDRFRKPGIAEEEGEITPEQISQAQELIIAAKQNFFSGIYSKGLEKIKNANNILKDDPEINELLRKSKDIVEITPEIKGGGKKNVLLRKGIDAYLSGNAKLSLNSIRYSSQLWPNNEQIIKLTIVIEKEFPDMAESEKLVPGIDLVNQKLQEGLELIYDGKYVAAISICKDVTELEPKNILALLRMGSAYWAMGHPKKAKDIWKQALKIDPNNNQIKKFLKMKEKTVAKSKTKVPEVIKKKADDKSTSEYNNAVSYYKRVKRYGAEKETLKRILRRMIDKFKDLEGLGVSYLYQEIEKLK